MSSQYLKRFTINLINKTFEIIKGSEDGLTKESQPIKGYQPCELTKEVFNSIKSLKKISKQIKKIDIDISGDGYSVAFAIPRKDILVWMDFTKDLSFYDWNQYIFIDINENDQTVKEYQTACTDDGYPYNYCNCSELGASTLSQIFGIDID